MTKVDKPLAQVPAKSDQEQTRAKGMAELAICPAANAALVIGEFTDNLAGKGGVGTADVMVSLMDSARTARDGNLSTLEAMLVSQATALQTIFSSYACRAQAQTQYRFREGFMTMALKAQAQSRATIQAIVELKFPRQATFVSQANIAAGPQQVNNGTKSVTPTRTKQNPNQQSKLLEETHDGSTYLDTRATTAATRGDPAMAAVGEIHRTKKRRR